MTLNEETAQQITNEYEKKILSNRQCLPGVYKKLTQFQPDL